MILVLELAIGKAAPEIVGTDENGKPLKLSDYRGNVVVLVFWASWCGPCMEQVPHEVALAKRLSGKPFTILGVNLDRTLAAARTMIEKEAIPWPNWCDGDPAKPGPIFALYHVQSVPVVYVLDPNGIIRAKDVHGRSPRQVREPSLGRILKVVPASASRPPLLDLPAVNCLAIPSDRASVALSRFAIESLDPSHLLGYADCAVIFEATGAKSVGHRQVTPSAVLGISEGRFRGRPEGFAHLVQGGRRSPAGPTSGRSSRPSDRPIKSAAAWSLTLATTGFD